MFSQTGFQMLKLIVFKAAASNAKHIVVLVRGWILEQINCLNVRLGRGFLEIFEQNFLWLLCNFEVSVGDVTHLRR